MKSRRLIAVKTGMLLLSSLGAVALFAGGYEVYKNIQYPRWKRNFDDAGRLGTITVASPNPELMWEYRPYGEFELIKVNRFGFRDRDFESPDKPENTYRVGFIGDSVTLGYGVTQEQTFVHLLQEHADRVNGPRQIQVLNFGIDGYNTPQILELMRTKALEFSPDKLVYMLCLNDFDFAYSSGKKIRYFRKPKSFFLAVLEGAYLVVSRVDFHRYHFRKNKSVVFENILAMKSLSEEEGIEFHVGILPVFPESHATFERYPLSDVSEKIEDFLSQHDISYSDLYSPFVESGNPLRYYADDIWHPNERGHRYLAKLLMPTLRAK